jgi:hypothetical protein
MGPPNHTNGSLCAFASFRLCVELEPPFFDYRHSAKDFSFVRITRAGCTQGGARTACPRSFRAFLESVLERENAAKASGVSSDSFSVTMFGFKREPWSFGDSPLSFGAPSLGFGALLISFRASARGFGERLLNSSARRMEFRESPIEFSVALKNWKEESYA